MKQTATLQVNGIKGYEPEAGLIVLENGFVGTQDALSARGVHPEPASGPIEIPDTVQARLKKMSAKT